MDTIYSLIIISLPFIYAVFIGDSVIAAAGFGVACGMMGALFFISGYLNRLKKQINDDR